MNPILFTYQVFHGITWLFGAYLLLVLPARWVQWLNQSCGVAHKHGVARGPYDHTQHGDPQVGHADRGPRAIPDAQHVAHGFEEGIRVLLTPGNVLQGRRKRQRGKKGGERERQRGGWGSYCKARQGRKALQQEEWIDFPLMYHWISIKHCAIHTLHASQLMPSLSGWTFYLSFFLPSFNTLFAWTWLYLFPICQRERNSSCLQVLPNNLHYLHMSEKLFPLKFWATTTARDSEKYRCSPSFALRFDIYKCCKEDSVHWRQGNRNNKVQYHTHMKQTCKISTVFLEENA